MCPASLRSGAMTWQVDRGRALRGSHSFSFGMVQGSHSLLFRKYELLC